MMIASASPLRGGMTTHDCFSPLLWLGAMPGLVLRAIQARFTLADDDLQWHEVAATSALLIGMSRDRYKYKYFPAIHPSQFLAHG